MIQNQCWFSLFKDFQSESFLYYPTRVQSAPSSTIIWHYQPQWTAAAIGTASDHGTVIVESAESEITYLHIAIRNKRKWASGAPRSPPGDWPVVLLVIPVILVARVPARAPARVGPPRTSLAHISCAIARCIDLRRDTEPLRPALDHW